MNDLRDDIRRFIADNFIMGANGVALADGDSFLDNHVLDSTGFLELIGHLEEHYGISIADEEMIPENLDSIDCIIEFLGRKRG